MNTPLIAVAGGLLVALFAVFMVALGWRSPQLARLEEVTRAGAGSGAPSGEARFERWARPLGRLGGLWGGRDNPAMARRLLLAGYRKPFHLEIFAGLRLALPALLAVAVAYAMPQGAFLWLMIAVVAGFMGPEFWLNRAIGRRRRAIALALPDMLDLLAICMQAGLGLDQAMARVGAEMGLSCPALSEELAQIALEQRAGNNRIEAWRGFAQRTGLDTVRSFVNMLAQTERFGTPVSRSLAVFSDTLRTRRRQKAEEAAAKTTIKMVVPLVLFIFPTVFIVTVAPAALRIAANFGKLV